MEILRATEDASVNFIESVADGGFIEARFVQRTEDTVIVYLSSATGCNLSCRFCHLTQTGQTMTGYETVAGYLRQARIVFDHMEKEGVGQSATIVHFNFMARGDALSNPHFTLHTRTLFTKLAELAKTRNLIPKFKISTIFPRDILERGSIESLCDWVNDVLDIDENVEFYYSLYSLRSSFRKKWLPKAVDPTMIGAVFQGTVGKMRLHHALIRGRNDSHTDILSIHEWLHQYDIRCRVNIVRYNPYNRVSCGTEPSEIEINRYCRRMELSQHIQGVHLVSRVGESVKASCGMFVE